MPKRRLAPWRWPGMRAPCAAWSVSAADAPPRRAVGVLRDRPGVSAVAWRPASDALPAGIPLPGSSAGWVAVRGISVRNPCEGTLATPAAGLWWQPPARQAMLPADSRGRGERLPVRLSGWYAAYVPWEGTTPWGRPGRMRLILLGHSPLLHSRSPLAVRRRSSCDRAWGPEKNQNGATTAADAREVAQRRKPGRRRTRCILGWKDTQAGVPDVLPEVGAKKPRQRDRKKDAYKQMRARPSSSPKTRPSSSPLPPAEIRRALAIEDGPNKRFRHRIGSSGQLEEALPRPTFDFGDDWWHQINVLAIDDAVPKGK